MSKVNININRQSVTQVNKDKDGKVIMDKLSLSTSLFYVPLDSQSAKVELSYLPGVYASLVVTKKDLRIQELAYERELDKLKDSNYFRERPNQSQRDAEKASKLGPVYDNIYQKYILTYAKREQIDGFIKALEHKSHALALIIKSEISEQYVQQ